MEVKFIFANQDLKLLYAIDVVSQFQNYLLCIKIIPIFATIKKKNYDSES